MQLNATAFNSCLIEKTIVKFMSDFTKCSLNIKTNYLMLVSKVGDDYSDVVPEILGTDIEASVTLNICKSDQKYYFWLRKNKNSYQVISYTSTDQPE